MSYNNNNLAISDNDEDNQKKDDKKADEERLYEKICIFGDFFGIIPKSFVRFFNLFMFQITFVIIFAIIYRILMIDFYTHFFIPSDFKEEHFTNHKSMIALFMSINFQSTVAYVDLKCRSFLSRFIITLQIISTFGIAFLFFL
jgi:hypothetical protein